jgi:hypothetical protein
MLVVVVVVSAMSESKQPVHIVENYVFRKSESTPHGIVNIVSIGDSLLEPGESYKAELILQQGPNGIEKIASFEVNVDNGGSVISIPKETIETTEMIEPGRTVNIKIFPNPKWDPNDFSDSSGVIARVETAKGKYDGTPDCRMYSAKVSKYLNSSKSNKLKFRNVRTNESAIAESHADYSSGENAFFFPIDAREKVSASPNDLIEIIEVEETEPISEGKDVERLIREMHSMMMEMYNDYLESQND